MKPYLPAWFFCNQASLNYYSKFTLTPSSIASEKDEQHRDLEITAVDTEESYKVTSGAYSQVWGVTSPLLLSSPVNFYYELAVNEFKVTKTGDSETREITYADDSNLASTTVAVDYNNHKLVHLPNKALTVQFVFPFSTIVSYKVPNFSTGVTCVSSLSSGTRSINSAAWGLLLACALDEPELVVSQLRELTRIVKQSGQLSDSSGQLLAVTEGFWGLTSLEPVPEETTVYVLDNALLGLAITKSLHYLNKISYFDNLLDNFLHESLELAKVFAYCCAESVSKINYWCAGVQEDGYYDYYQLSLKTSYISSLFFNSFLLLQYDSLVHEKAARLYLSIINAPLKLNDFFYDIFTDTEQLDTLSYKLWWLLEFKPHDFNSFFSIYYGYKTSVTDSSDFLVAALVKQSSLTTPSWVTSLLLDTSDEALLLEQTQLEIYELTPVACGVTNFLLTTDAIFNLYAVEASAYTSYCKEELIRMSPDGDFWSSVEAQEDRSTNIGALLYAYSQSYFVWFLRYSLVRLPLLDSRGFILTELLKLVFPLASYLSEEVSRSVLDTLYRQPNLSVKERLATLLKVDFEQTYNNPELYSVLQSLEDNTYTAPNKTFNHLYFEELEYRAIAYYQQQAVGEQEGIFSTLTTNKNQSQLRPIPGFPYDTASSLSGDKFVEPLENFTGLVSLSTKSPIPTGLSAALDWIAPVGVRYIISGEFNIKAIAKEEPTP
jgi:hypothetical protein